MVIIRYLFVLLVGFLGGAGTTLWLVQSGAGDFMIRRTEAVQDLERRLREMEQQRNALGRQLEDVVSRATRMESAFSDLERRFRDMQERAGRDVEAERTPPATRPADPPRPPEGVPAPRAVPPPAAPGDGAHAPDRPREPS